MSAIDVRHLWRNLRRAPASAIAAVLTLSLTLGAGASIFAVVDAVLLTPLPYAEPEALVSVGEAPLDDLAAAPAAVRYATFEAWRERAQSIAALEAFDPANLTLTGLGAAERVRASNVTTGFLALLGVRPELGRQLDDNDGGRAVVMVSHDLWRRKLNRSPDAIGRELLLGNVPHTIVGILPESFSFVLTDTELWRPFPVAPGQAAATGYRVQVIARLVRDRSLGDLQTALAEISRAATPPARVVARPVAAVIVGHARSLLGVLAGAAALGMVAAFINLAGLLVVRSIDRRRELAVRTALGARRAEITRQLLLESLALALVGLAGGVLIALWLTPLVARLSLEQFGTLAGREVGVNWRIVAIVAIVATLCAIVCAWLPSRAASRWSVVDVLRRGVTPPPGERRLRRVFVGAEVALAFVLLVSVVLLGRSLDRMLGANAGFEPRGVVALQVSLPTAAYPTPARIAGFYQTLHRALNDRLGAGAAAVVDEMPLTGDRGRTLVPIRTTDEGREAVLRSAGDAYFSVMRIPIVDGRPLADTDDASLPLRAVISKSLAERLFPRERAVGRQVRIAATAQNAEIVGVAGDVKHRDLDEPDQPTVYVSSLQSPSPSSIVLVRSAQPIADVISAVRDEVWRLDRDLPVYNVRTLDDVVAASPGVPARRLLTAAFAGFAVLAVAIVVLGLFGVVAHDVASRKRELALRLALGADRSRLMRATFGQGAAIVGGGLAAGALLSFWAVRALGSWILTAGEIDLVSIAIAGFVLLTTVTIAILPAALRAARIDPVTALAEE